MLQHIPEAFPTFFKWVSFHQKSEVLAFILESSIALLISPRAKPAEDFCSKCCKSSLSLTLGTFALYFSVLKRNLSHSEMPHFLRLLAVITASTVFFGPLSGEAGSSHPSSKEKRQTSLPSNTTAFHFSFGKANELLHRRATTYVTNEGYLTGDQSQATVFYINNQPLYGDGDMVSANAPDQYIPFAASNVRGTISTTWKYGSLPQGSNKAFVGNGVAKYCKG